jgi:hypothetical protein
LMRSNSGRSGRLRRLRRASPARGAALCFPPRLSWSH